VRRVSTLVAEVAVDLVDALDAADDRALEVQLRRDAQVQVSNAFECVMNGRADAPPCCTCSMGVSTSR